ncbi:hypothetical protein EVAR_65547_1 [Eumeta japonica]|uniref:Uncharacterized protein n=1 Tax=Eumeta variegata TaxID=151549 RepID=A0A4C1ZS45_EUMVA|nr:hypothetical protein EVAR_65547_1 [Eumeta japonica]
MRRLLVAGSSLFPHGLLSRHTAHRPRTPITRPSRLGAPAVSARPTSVVIALSTHNNGILTYHHDCKIAWVAGDCTSYGILKVITGAGVELYQMMA